MNKFLSRTDQRTHAWFMVALLSAISIVLLLCAGCSSLSNAQAEADVYSIVAPAHKTYVDHDVTMATDAKARRYELLDAWKKRVIANGGVVK